MDAEFVNFLSEASPALMLAAFIVLLFRPKGPLVLRRELDNCYTRIDELRKEKDEYKSMAFQSLNLGERVVTAAERNGR